jgi:hypothetical protein
MPDLLDSQARDLVVNAISNWSSTGRVEICNAAILTKKRQLSKLIILYQNFKFIWQQIDLAKEAGSIASGVDAGSCLTPAHRAA